MLTLDVLVGLLLAVLLGLLAVGLRRRLLVRGGGTIDLSLRLRPRAPGRGWALGIGRFDGDDLHWFRMFSLAPRPRRTVSRRDLRVQQTRQPSGGEALSLLKGVVVMECASSTGTVELAMNTSARTGFLAWLEAQPPGATLPY